MKPTNRKALFLIFIANGISSLAQGISMLSIPWYFAQKHQTADFNLYYVYVTFITLFWSMGAGIIVDRFDRKRIFLMNNLLEMILIGFVAIFGLVTHQLPDIFIVLVFFVTVCGYNIHYPNLYGLVQEITPSKNYTTINSYLEIVGQGTNLLSGFLGALLLEGFDGVIPYIKIQIFEISPWNIWEIFMLDALTYAMAIVLISQIRYVSEKRRTPEKGVVLKRIRSGIQFLKLNPMVLKFGLFSYSVFIVMLISIHALSPAYVKNHLLSSGIVFALTKVASASGSFFSGILSRWCFKGMRSTQIVILLCMLSGVVFIIIGITQYVWVFLIMTFIFGFCNVGIRIYRLSWLYTHVPNHFIGRVSGVFSMANVVIRMLFISLFATSFFNTGSNIVYAYMLMGAGMIFAGLMLMSNYHRFQNMPHV